MSHEGLIKKPIGSSLGSWYHQASSTWTQVGNGYNLYVPKSGGGDSITGRYETAPSTPYTIIAHTSLNPTDQTGLMLAGGLGFTDGTATYFFNTRAQANSQTSSWSILYCSTSTLANANDAGYQYGPGFPWTSAIGWMAIRDDGTNIYWYVGDESGQNFYEIYHTNRTGRLTPSSVGIFTDNASSASIDMMVNSWKVLSV